MKLLYALLSALFSIVAYGQSFTAVTMTGMGDIKLGMKQTDLEKLLGQPLKLPHVNSGNGEYYQDTVHIQYKGLEADVVFQRDYVDEKKYNVTVWEVRSNSATLKTKSGISIGDDKYKIIRTYEGYVIWIMPEYENDYTVKSKTRSSIWLHSDSGNVIIFHLDNNKVTAMSVTYFEGD